jgi:tRNA(fMet)-specific endonuclease VapC
MVILDTDHMSVLERREQPGLGALLRRLAELPPSEVVTTVISYEEQIRGWMAYLARARSMAQQITAYGRLLAHLENYRRIPVLGFDEAAAMVFQRLRRSRLRIGTMDLKIAAIVLARDAALPSRNLSDFGWLTDKTRNLFFQAAS